MVASAIGAVLLADFITGIVHWWEDAYGDPSWPVVGPLVVKPNIDHHEQPRLFLKSSFLMRNYQPFLASWVSMAIAWALGLPWWIVFALFLAGFGNEVHAWAHRSRKDNGRLISCFQEIGLIQGVRHHAVHHQCVDRQFCTLTNFLNPLLELIGFWVAIEWVLARVGIPVRAERR